ncbi:hypothetical protein PG988_004662 [Apiospora saccharicola]
MDCRYGANSPRGSTPGISQQIAESASARSPDSISSGTNTPPDARVYQNVDNISDGDDFMIPLEAESGDSRAALNWAESQDAELFPFMIPIAGRSEIIVASSPKAPQRRLPSTALQTNLPFPLPKALSFPNEFTIPRSPSSNIRSLIRRPKLKTGAQRVASLVCHTLKSYPLMMMRDKTLPPFIHPQMLRSESGAQDMEPLHNCISLMSMLHGGLQGSRKLFWRNVRQECERLYKEPSRLSYLEVLAALQALSIYIIIRLDDGETEENDIDGLLIMTVIVSLLNTLETLSVPLLLHTGVEDTMLTFTDFLGLIYGIGKNKLRTRVCVEHYKSRVHMEALDVGRVRPTVSCISLSFQVPSQGNNGADYVKYRLCVLYQIVNMVVVFEPAAMCDLHLDGLILSPLPARRQLWEADTAAKWMSEIERDLGSQTDYGMTVSGDLVKVSESPVNGSMGEAGAWPRQKADWEEWLAGMDSFGGLVMLAASLVG